MAQIRTRAPWWLRLSLRVAGTEVGTSILSRTLPHIERVVERVSGGRISLSRLLSGVGVPVVTLTTIGAKTGTERTTPVLGLRGDNKWIVVASNWGRERHPAWYHNLRANPEVKLTYKGRTNTYVARQVTGERREEYWRQAAAVNPGLETYQQRSGDRQIPVVVLTPNGEWESDTAP